jgi:hypothetical protein
MNAAPGASAVPLLPANRTFVVQFGAPPEGAPDGVTHGRAEHLVSASAARFETWSELREFVERVLLRADQTSTDVDR